MATNGSGWRILVGGTTVADKIVCETSAGLDINQDTIEVTCKDSIWKAYLGGERGWSMPFEAVKDETAGSTQADIIDNIFIVTGKQVYRDWKAFEQTVKELEESFQEGGSNSHRNPMVKS